MVINNYTKLDLEKLLDDPLFWNQETIPISRNRILSQIHNPRCNSEDILLSTVILNEKLEGFIGFLPEHIHDNGINKKVYWISTWWSNPESSLRGVGTILLLNGLKTHQGKLGVSVFTPDAKKIYDQLGIFTAINHFNGFHHIYSLSYVQIKKRIPQINSFPHLFKWLFSIINQCIFLTQKVLWKQITRKIKPHTVSSLELLNEEVQQFISPFLEKDLTKRDIEIFNWVFSYPWVSIKPTTFQNDPKYPFSRYCDISFEYKNILIRNEQEDVIVLMIVTIHDDILKVPYIYCLPEDYSIAAFEVMRIVKDKGISIVTVFNEKLNQALRKGLLHIRTPYKKEMIVTDEFLKEITQSEVTIQDGEADWIFT